MVPAGFSYIAKRVHNLFIGMVFDGTREMRKNISFFEHALLLNY